MTLWWGIFSGQARSCNFPVRSQELELGRLIGPELRELLQDNPAALGELVDELHPQDVSESLEELDDEVVSRALTSLPLDFGAQVFERLPEERQILIAKHLGVNSTVRLVTEMSADDAVDFFGLLPKETASKLFTRLEAVDPEQAEEVRELTIWPEQCAGGLMNNEYVVVSDSVTVDAAIAALRIKAAEGYEVLDVVFLEGMDESITGFVTLRSLLLSAPDVLLSHIMQHNMVSVEPELDQEEVARTFARYDLHALPVLDKNRRMLGIITSDDVIDVVEEEAEEDAHRMAAVEPMENSYFAVPFFVYLRKRAPWLLILFIGGFFSTSVMERFSGTLRSLTQLAFYIPLLISAGGNSGSQSATLIIRGLTVGDIQTRDWWKVFIRELGQGLIIGTGLALVGVARAWFGGDGSGMAILIGLTIVSLVTLGCVVGAMMPLLMERLGVDPATSSTPFIATLIDALGVIVYLSLARWLLMGANAVALTTAS
jgi:magnesium transporter